MKLRAKGVPMSGVVGKCVMLEDADTGACVATLGIRVPNTLYPYGETAEKVAEEIVRLFNGQTEAGPDKAAARTRLKSTLVTMQGVVVTAESIAPRHVEDDRMWEEAYTFIFEVASKVVSECLGTLGLRLNYLDPDSSYEDDVKAYVRAVRDLVDGLEERE